MLFFSIFVQINKMSENTSITNTGKKTKEEKLREIWRTPGASAKIDAQREKWKNEKLPKEEILRRKREKVREKRAKLREENAPER